MEPTVKPPKKIFISNDFLFTQEVLEYLLSIDFEIIVLKDQEAESHLSSCDTIAAMTNKMYWSLRSEQIIDMDIDRENQHCACTQEERSILDMISAVKGMFFNHKKKNT